MGLANSIALKLAGITKNTPDPPGGEIVKDPKTGEPTASCGTKQRLLFTK
jgi:predicted amidohydrolase YtcJ